jgi:MFS family permease
MINSLTFSVLTLLHGSDGKPLIAYWSAVLLATSAGIIRSFDLPARQAFLLEMVPHEDLQNAIALNSLTFNGARVIGPALAGAIVAYFDRTSSGHVAFGEGMCFLIDGLSFLAVLTSLIKMKLAPQVKRKKPANTQKYLLDGLKYVRTRPHLYSIMIHLMFMALFGIPYLMIIPVYAKEVLHGDALTFGKLMTAVGIGAVVGGTRMALRKSVKGLGTYIMVCTFGFSVTLTSLSLIHHEWMSFALLGVAGFFMVMAMIASQTLTQTLVPEQLRGRVMSLYSMISVGVLPFGSLFSGSLAERFGVNHAFQVDAAMCAVAATYFAIRLPKLRASARATDEYKRAIGLPVVKKTPTQTAAKTHAAPVTFNGS